MRTKKVVVALCWAAVCLLASCGSPRGPGLERDATTPSLVWPPPPEASRIMYLRSIATPNDVGITKSFFRRVVEFITGPEQERIAQPYGVHVDTQNRIFVVDSAAKFVHLFDYLGGSYTRIPGRASEDLRFPIDVALDDQGRLYVTDAEGGKVFGFDLSGKRLFEQSWKGALKRPTGITYNPANRLLYVVDSLEHRVLAFDPSGVLRFQFGSRGEDDGQFNYPTNITSDREGRLYVTDSMNFRVQIFDRAGTFLSKFGRHGDALGDFSKPKGIALDSDGHIYVVEGLFDVILIYDQSGRFLLSFGGPGNGPGQFWLATGIFIDAQDRIYVADSYNHRIQVFQYLKEVKGGGGAKR